MNNHSTAELPAFVRQVTGEVDDSYWKPQNFKEWANSVQWTSWARQQHHLQKLRWTIAIWLFSLITVQVLAVFAIVVCYATGYFTANEGIIKFLIPSVMTEVFGMGFLVVKYLFRASKSDEKTPPK